MKVLRRSDVEVPKNEIIQGYALLRDIKLAKTKNGDPYFRGSVVLGDGDIVPFNAWGSGGRNEAFEELGKFNYEDETVLLTGSVDIYKGFRSLVLDSVAAVELDSSTISSFYKEPPLSEEKLESLVLKNLQELIHDEEGLETLSALLENVRIKRNCNGIRLGLMLKVYTVLRVIKTIYALYPEIRSDALALGVLVLAEKDGDGRKGYESVRVVRYLPDNKYRSVLEEIAHGTPCTYMAGVVHTIYNMVTDLDAISESKEDGTTLALGSLVLN